MKKERERERKIDDDDDDDDDDDAHTLIYVQCIINSLTRPYRYVTPPRCIYIRRRYPCTYTNTNKHDLHRYAYELLHLNMCTHEQTRL